MAPGSASAWRPARSGEIVASIAGRHRSPGHPAPGCLPAGGAVAVAVAAGR